MCEPVASVYTEHRQSANDALHSERTTMQTKQVEVLINATIGGKPLYGPVGGLAARAYGISVCIQIRDWAQYTPIRFV